MGTESPSTPLWIRRFALAPIAVAALQLAFSLSAIAQTDSGRGLEIALTMKERDRGFGNFTADMRMVLLDASGKQTLRKLRTKTLEAKDDGDKVLAVFDAPADVKGTVFLSHTHRDRADDQWLYLPALKRVKRIASANKTSPFMGSEFSYEDLASSEVEKFTYAYRGEDTLDGGHAFVIERRPVDPNSGYSRQVVWVDQVLYVELKIEFYDRRGAKLKTLTAREYRQYLGAFWRAHVARMDNHQSGRSSVLVWSNIRFRQDLDDQDFLPASMARTR